MLIPKVNLKNDTNIKPEQKRISIGLCGFRSDQCVIDNGKRTKDGQLDFTFFDIGDFDFKLDHFDGIIFAGGAFENIKYEESYIHGLFAVVRYNQSALTQRYKEATNIIKKGKWISFLTSRMFKSVSGADFETIDMEKFDLPKIFLNDLNIRWDPLQNAVTLLKSIQNEFHHFIENFGVGFNLYSLPNNDNYQVLATKDNRPFAFSVARQIFFLPYSFDGMKEPQITEACISAAKAICDFKLKNEITIPSWVSSIEFPSEIRLNRIIAEKEQEIKSLKDELESMGRYKAILTTSGANLVNICIDILKNYFGLTIKTDEKFVEDISISDESGLTTFILEIKGTKAGVQRKNINQVDDHRERNQLDSSVRGVLIINDSMEINGLNERRSIKVHSDILTHAANQNVKIIRTPDLLEFMITCEKDEIATRAQKLQDWLRS